MNDFIKMLIVISSEEIKPNLGLGGQLAGNSNWARIELNLKRLTYGCKIFMKQLT